MRGETGPDPAPEYWEAVGGTWASTHRDELWRRCSDAIHARWLDRAASGLPPGRVLKTDLFDEAFGDGLAPWFESHGHDLVACDLALTTARGAVRKPSRVVAAVADVRRLPFSDMVFDTVFSDSTLDHFDAEPAIRQSLEELCRVLKPGGTLLLTMDNPENPLVWFRNLAPRFWLRAGVVPYAVGATCSSRRLAHWLREAGFNVTATDAIMHVPRVLTVPICRGLAATGSLRLAAQLRRWLLAGERLGALPTSRVTGHFVAVVAQRAT
jgi:SAM-dependent methyltransferase